MMKSTEKTPKVNPGFLVRAVERKRAEVARGRARTGEAELVARARERGPARDWPAALTGPGVAVVAEIKRRSPSAGELAPDADPVERARAYARGGAAAVSVLTDAAFDGRLDDLTAVAAAADRPVLRKDFLVDAWQVWESRAAGADAALILVAAVGDEALAELAEAARSAGLGLLVEVHGVDDLDRALAIEPAVLGVNARDLTSLDVSFDRMLATLAEARRRLPAGTALVAESGIGSPLDVTRAADAGADAVLVGEHLMRAADPIAAVRALLEAGRP